MIILHNYSGTRVVFLMIHALFKEHSVQFRWCKENREEDLSLILSTGDWPTKPSNMDPTTSNVPLSSMPWATQSVFPPSRTVPRGCAWAAGQVCPRVLPTALLPHSPGQQDLWAGYFSFQLSAQVSLQKKEASAQEVRTLGTGTTDTHPALLPLHS